MSKVLIAFVVLLVLVIVACIMQARANRKVDELLEASEAKDAIETQEMEPMITVGGVTYRIYISSNGNRYILRKSRNDKYYRQYLEK